MKIYLIKREDDIGYDEYAGFVVAAVRPEDATRLVLEELGHSSYKRDSHKVVWSSLPVVCIGRAARGVAAGIILYDFNAG